MKSLCPGAGCAMFLEAANDPDSTAVPLFSSRRCSRLGECRESLAESPAGRGGAAEPARRRRASTTRRGQALRSRVRFVPRPEPGRPQERSPTQSTGSLWSHARKTVLGAAEWIASPRYAVVCSPARGATLANHHILASWSKPLSLHIIYALIDCCSSTRRFVGWSAELVKACWSLSH